MNKMTVVSTYPSIIILNVSGINFPIQTHRMAEWMKKQDPAICYLPETHFSFEDTHTRSDK